MDFTRADEQTNDQKKMNAIFTQRCSVYSGGVKERQPHIARS